MQVDTLQEITSNEVYGLGPDVIKICDKTGKTICYLGKEDILFFENKTVPASHILVLAELLNKKKMKKALVQGNYQKAQEIVLKQETKIKEKIKKKKIYKV